MRSHQEERLNHNQRRKMGRVGVYVPHRLPTQ
jgi:hypothetical protein